MGLVWGGRVAGDHGGGVDGGGVVCGGRGGVVVLQFFASISLSCPLAHARAGVWACLSVVRSGGDGGGGGDGYVAISSLRMPILVCLYPCPPRRRTKAINQRAGVGMVCPGVD